MKRIALLLLVAAQVWITLGCQTYPSQLNDLGVETGAPTVVGESTYMGWYGLTGRDKHEVYESALRGALEKAPRGTEKLGDVKLWTKQYVGPQIALAFVPGVVAAIVYDSGIAALIVSLGTLLVSGLEIEGFIVTGVPQ